MPPGRGAEHSRRCGRKYTKDCNSTRCGPCGRVACDCSLRNEWETRATAGVLRRAEDYRAACGIVADGPVAIHFNGVSKTVMTESDALKAWLQRGFPDVSR